MQLLDSDVRLVHDLQRPRPETLQALLGRRFFHQIALKLVPIRMVVKQYSVDGSNGRQALCELLVGYPEIWARLAGLRQSGRDKLHIRVILRRVE